MLQTYTSEVAVSGAALPAVIVHGRNKALTVTVGITGYTLSASPLPERMRVRQYQGVWLTSAKRRMVGAGVHLAMLTGEVNAALASVHYGIQGSSGALAVRAPAPFLCEYGLATIIMAMPAGDYFLRTVVVYEPA